MLASSMHRSEQAFIGVLTHFGSAAW